MLPRISPIPLVALAAAVPVTVLAAPGTEVGVAPAQKKRQVPVTRSPDLWATINVCDTERHPNTIGIRGSMPALGVKSTLMMRIQVQYLARADGKWHNIETGADSGWRSLGRERKKVVEGGQNFEFQPPADGGAHRLRGSVRYKWLRGKRVVERARRFTEAGHRSTAGADPEGYSAALCDVG